MGVGIGIGLSRRSCRCHRWPGSRLLGDRGGSSRAVSVSGSFSEVRWKRGYAYVVEIQSVDQVGHVCSAPGYHLVSLDVGVSPGREPLLHEQNLGVMVCTLGEDTVSSSPGGDHVEWHTETSKNRSELEAMVKEWFAYQAPRRCRRTDLEDLPSTRRGYPWENETG